MKVNVLTSVLLALLCIASFAYLAALASCEEKPIGSHRCGDGICDVSGRESPVRCRADCGGMLLTTGGAHTCGLLGDGTAWCWGYNEDGQLGTGDLGDRTEPTRVQFERDVVMISAGGYHTCAVTGDDKVWCWGRNNFGQLGPLFEGITFNALPARVPGLNGVVAISAGKSHTCALLSDRTVWCWGSNRSFQLGVGLVVEGPQPVQPVGVSEVEALSAGSGHSCAVKTDGTAWCWGKDDDGQLGDGDPGRPHLQSDLVPGQVVGLAGIRSIAAGGKFTCAVLEDGTVWCWGDNSEGQLGVPDLEMSSTPVWVSDVSGAATIASGDWHACVVHYNGAVSCWGRNEFGETGSGYEINPQRPLQVAGVAGAVGLAADKHTCVVTGDQGAWCWGTNRHGELGIGSDQGPEICGIQTACSTVPVEVVQPF